jgi:type I restriction enzyme R subunit
MSNEADTCRTYVLPRLQAAGWTDEQIREQLSFTDGRILVAGRQARRARPKRADYLLCYRRDYPLAVVEAKASYRQPTDGMQQAKDYAQILGLYFAYATNGKRIIEFDFTTGQEQEVDTFPSPLALWNRLRTFKGLDPAYEDKLLVPFHTGDRVPRYYQQIAINRAVEAILQGKRRVLLTLATGTGKTEIAFQIVWKLWHGNWNTRGLPNQHPRVLFLSDRTFLVDDPKDKTFAPFGDARHKIEHGVAVKSREIYFATYQAIAKDDARPGLYREYPPDFFDLVIVDEAHRGSARDDSNWREILEYFTGAVQLGMTATPLREDNRDTYLYFGNPIYTYSLKQGIQDGFLAPYQVRRVILDVDVTGFRPYDGQLDDYGREIPDREYGPEDFEAIISLKARTQAAALHLTNYLKQTDRFAKTIVFCYDQEHANQMRQALSNANADLVQQYPDYVVRVTADDTDLGKGYLSTFQDVETKTPVILTTSRLLTTGVDAPLVQNVVLFRVIKSMTDFKQIIGRGTRVREDYGKLFFTIVDYTGSATRNFADPAFDGEPARITEEEADAAGNQTQETEIEVPVELLEDDTEGQPPQGPHIFWPPEAELPRKYYLSKGVSVAVLHEQVQELDANGKLLRTVQFTTYAGEQVKSLYPNADAFRGSWAVSESRAVIIDALAEHGITVEHLMAVTEHPEADPFDLLCHLAFNAPLRSRRERADRLRKEQRAFFAQYSKAAQQILDALLEQYAEYGPTEIVLPEVLKVPVIARYGNLIEIARFFGGAPQLREAIKELQALLYAA